MGIQLEAAIATTSALDGKVSKTGDTMTGPLILPDNTAAGQALQIHAFDAATGRLAYEVDGVVFEVGDTGWRDVNASLINGWAQASTYPQIRRVGNSVHLRAVNLDGVAATAGTFLDLPAGFTYIDSLGVFTASNGSTESNTAPSYRGRLTTSSVRLVHGTAITYTFTTMWSTTATWPVTLPGVAA